MIVKIVDLTYLKSDVDRLDIDKVGTTLVDLGKVNNVVKIDAVKRLYMINCKEKLMLFSLFILAI